MAKAAVERRVPRADPATACPSCGAPRCESFYEAHRVPTNSCLLVNSREAALAFPTGDIRLCFCRQCGFIFNAAFDPHRTRYSDQYEETQGYSPTFNRFHRQLAEELIERHGLRGKEVLEIGCGKGEFLALLCELGPNRGIGYDPSFVPSRLGGGVADRVRVVRELVTADTALPEADFLCCKMTLEHIPDTGAFAATVRRGVGGRRDATIFFQVPDVIRILEEGAFWDIYYEHCSYFSPASLQRLFQAAGFDILRVWTGYDDQYLMIEARAADRNGAAARPGQAAPSIADLGRRVADFAATVASRRAAWADYAKRNAAAGRKTVLWGSGSKAVAFLTTLGLQDEIDFVVDINPHRHGKFMPGTGQSIVAPEFLASYRPDAVVVMNPIYRQEIAETLAGLNCRPALLTVIDPLPKAA